MCQVAFPQRSYLKSTNAKQYKSTVKLEESQNTVLSVLVQQEVLYFVINVSTVFHLPLVTSSLNITPTGEPKTIALVRGTKVLTKRILVAVVN